jgi:hypothetical protein
MSVTARAVTGWVGIVFLIAVSLLGLQAAIGQLSDAATMGQWICTWTQWGYAVIGPVAAGGLLLRRSWHRPAFWIWTVLVTVTGGLAPVVWGGSGPLVGLAAGLASAAMAGVVVLLVNRMPRD